MSFHGGLIGIIIATIIFTRIRKIYTFIYLDIISCVTPIGLFLGRIANFINGELYGKTTDLPWGVIFPNAGTFARHPSQIYEAISEGLLLFIILNFLAFRRKLIFKQGLISVYFLFFYSVFRFFSETFREPDEQLGYLIYFLTMGQLLSLIMILFGVVIYYKIK
jgi:phosphatidylglycerol:prolipoprotein diacylglycerol transferase